MHVSDTRMTEGGIPRQLIAFTAPLFAGNLFQQLYNTADALIVGRMLGNDALAAVSATGNLSYLLISIFMGIAAGSGVLLSRYYGARDTEKLRSAVRTNLAFSFLSGLLMTLIGVAATPTLLHWMGTPEDVMALAVAYMRILFAGSLGLVLYNSLPSGVQNSAIGLAKVVVQAKIKLFGTMAVAGCGAYGKLEGFAFLSITSFTLALTAFVGQNLGAGEHRRAKRGAAFGIVSCLLAASHSLAAVLRARGTPSAPASPSA